MFFHHLLLSIALAAAATPTGVLPETIVVGKRGLKKIPARESELGGETLDVPDVHEVSLSRLLRESPAVVVRQTGGEGSPPEFLIRGMDPIQNRYFLEGVPLTDAAYNNANASLIPLDALSGVDLYPEGVPVYLAEDGLGGAVQMRLASSAASSVGARAGLYGYVRVGGNAGGGSLPANAHLDYTQSQEDFRYYDDNGTPFNPGDDTFGRRTYNGFRRFTFLPEARLIDRPRQSLKVFGLGVYGEKEIPGALDQPMHGRLGQWYGLAAIHHTIDLDGGWRSESQLYVRADAERLANLDPAVTALWPTESTDVGVGAKAGVSRELFGGRWDLVSGAGWDQFRVAVTGPPSSGAWNGRLAVPVGLSGAIPLGVVTVKPAVMAHLYRYQPAGGAPSSYGLASPRVGVVARPWARGQLRATAGLFYRAPSLFEMYGSPAGIAAAPSLNYERALKGDVGFDWELVRPAAWVRAARLSYTFSASRAHDLITYVQNSQATKVAVNVGESEVIGHEIAAELQSEWDLGARAAVTFLGTRNLSDVAAQAGKELPHRPPYQADVTISYARGPWSVAYEAAVYGPMYWDLANAKLLSAAVNHNLRASWETRSVGSWALEIDNITDVISSPSSVGAFQTVDNSTGYFGYPAPGRRWYLSWHYDL